MPILRKKIIFLGRRISEGEVRPDPERVKKVKEWLTPRDKQELMSFLGFAGYYRDFIKNYAHISNPLTELLVIGKEWDSGDTEEEVSIQLKQHSPAIP